LISNKTCSTLEEIKDKIEISAEKAKVVTISGVVTQNKVEKIKE